MRNEEFPESNLELGRDFELALQMAKFISRFIKNFTLGTLPGLQVLPQLKQHLLIFAWNQNPE
jgi:hypothetical protein